MTMRFCAICGWVFFNPAYEVPWMHQFRGCKCLPLLSGCLSGWLHHEGVIFSPATVYTCPAGVFLTGVGCYHLDREDSCIAPPDPRAR